MKNSFIAILLSLVFTISVFPQKSYSISVKTNSGKAMIFIDGEFAGNHSVDTEIAGGFHEVFVTQRGRAWNAEKFIDTVLVNQNNSVIELNYEFSKLFFVNSIPQNCKVMNNESLLAYTPTIIASKYDSLTLSKKNHIPVTLKFSDIPEVSTVKLDFSGVAKKEHFVDTPWFKVLIGSAVALGATAAYYKIQADQKYDKYNETHDRSLLDDIDRLDLYSGIAFGLLQVNFGYLIYEFIFMD